MYHYITFLGHPSDPQHVVEAVLAAEYHYITFLGHPSDGWIYSTAYIYDCTITLHFWGILPT